MEYRSPEPAADHAGAQTKKRSVKKPNNKILLWAVILVVILALLGAAAFLYHQNQNSKLQLQKLNQKLSNPQEVAKAEQTELIAQVGKITVLPTGETPTVATVSDISKLKDQAFFTNAQNGDKVLIYTTAKKAYLYRPATNKIINIAPVNLGDGSSTAPAATNSTTKKP